MWLIYYLLMQRQSGLPKFKKRKADLILHFILEFSLIGDNTMNNPNNALKFHICNYIITKLVK